MNLSDDGDRFRLQILRLCLHTKTKTTRLATSPQPASTCIGSTTNHERIRARFLACLARLSFAIHCITFRAAYLCRSVASMLVYIVGLCWREVTTESDDETPSVCDRPQPKYCRFSEKRRKK
ncbi:hypothetical protein E2C01_015726 [Portunus trituberculatus]|uniref:Uncharacterized protein n=1 Tax=Portunus trituberculatus TaxID=210409 RepID=A0A5B7DNE2_PORTR|nr:hypothetical protein [Portunus trituberculatus]